MNYSSPDAPRTYTGDYSWDASMPNSLTCGESGVTFPNDEYETMFKTYTSSGGLDVELRYFAGPYSETGDGVWLDGCMDYYKMYYTVRTVMNAFSSSFSSGGNVTLGAIGYEIFHEYARHTPSYVYRYKNYGGVVYSPEECEADAQPWYNCRFHSYYNGFGHELDFIDLMRTYYNRLAAADGAETAAGVVSRKLGYDVEAFVEEHLFGAACDYITKPAVEDLSAGNLLGWIDTFAALATDYERTDWIQFLYEYEAYGTRWYGRDGVYMESYMYAQHAMNGYSEGVTLIGEYFDAWPDSEAIGLKELAEDLQAFADLGHGNILQVELPNRQWPANGDAQGRKRVLRCHTRALEG